MPLTERQRHDAYEALHQAFGDHTDTVIELLRPDHDHLATREDLTLGLSDVRTEIADVRTEMAELRTELKTEMANGRTEMRDLTAVQTRTLLLAMFAAVLFNVVFNIVLVVLVD